MPYKLLFCTVTYLIGSFSAIVLGHALGERDINPYEVIGFRADAIEFLSEPSTMGLIFGIVFFGAATVFSVVLKAVEEDSAGDV